MLPKIWKKVLLAICIVACLFNITSKLVNKTSLKANLDSIVNGKSLTDIVKSFDKSTYDEITEITSTITTNAIENTSNVVVLEENVIEENIIEEDEIIYSSEEDVVTEEKDTGVSYKDFLFF